MKSFLLLLLITFSSTLFSKAQFSSDPANPLSVCAATGTQSGVHALSDNHGGYYAFWIDPRAGSQSADIYGQHFTSAGNSEWEADGRLIVGVTGKSVYDFKIVPWQNGLLLAWEIGNTGAPDSLFCQYFDTAGAPLWDTAVLVANRGEKSIIYMENDGFNIFPNSLGATIAYAVTISGGADYFSFNRISFAGKLRWPRNNFLFVNGSYYNYRSCSDGLGGIYAVYKGNGLGTSMALQRYDTAGTELFSNPIVFTTGSAGFGGNITLNSDASGSIYATWDDYAGKVFVTKMTKNGSFAWTPAYRRVSDFASAQSYSYSIMNGGKIYTIWDDNRPASGGNLSFYVQRTDTTGVNDWTPGGVKVCNMNCYIPYPKIALSDSGSIIALYETNNGLYGQKIRADTSIEYPVNGKLIVSNTNKVPSYNDFVLVGNGSECVAGFWATSTGDIYATQLCSPAISTGIQEKVIETDLRLFPNPSSSYINWAIPNTHADNVTLTINDVSGRQVYNQNTHASSGTIDVSAFAKGMYILQSVSGKSIYTRKLIVE